MGKLFVISTPIGNLEDITLRAIRVLREVDFIACEDTRQTGLLLQQLKEVPPPTRLHPSTGVTSARDSARETWLLSYYEENELQRIPQIIGLLKDGKNIALVSNAGTPTLSDPGFKLVRECITQGIVVEAIPGPSALLTALVSSGLPTDKFLFLGYLPKKSGKRKKLLENIKMAPQSSNNIAINNMTIIFYESPYRLLKTLDSMLEIFGDISIVICRELTKVHEEIRRERVSEAIKHFEQIKPQGEFTLLINLS